MRCTDTVNWPDLAGVHGEEAIEEDKNANQGCRDQHAGVPAQPRKVKTNFLTKVSSVREKKMKKHVIFKLCICSIRSLEFMFVLLIFYTEYDPVRFVKIMLFFVILKKPSNQWA